MASYAQELTLFLAQATVVSLTGVLSPGVVTAATMALGVRGRHAGALVAVGHGIVEFPLMLLIIFGAAQHLKNPNVHIGIGLAGGAMLILLAVQMLRGVKSGAQAAAAPRAARGPILTGIILTAGNPLFLVWWATVGLALPINAAKLGVLAFALFAVVHWLCDLAFLEALTLATFKGAKLLGDRAMRWVQVVCATAVLVIAAKFIVDAAMSLVW
jgi:threonine/homoserine/homoserine lactone efflux protein